MKKKFFLTAVAVMSLGVLAGCGGGGGGGASSQAPASQGGSGASGDLNIGEIKVWVDQKIQTVTGQQIDAFKAAHPGYNLTYKIEPRSESGAAGDVILDPTAAADIYIFAQDQLTRLVTANAIAAVPNAYKDQVVAENDAASITGATTANKLYAYPVTKDNTYVMYYNKADLAGVDLTDFNAIVAKVKTLSGKKVFYEVSSAWYNAAFFHGVGTHSEWTTNDKGLFTGYDDTYASAKGQIAVKGMHELFSDSSIFVNSSDADAFDNGASVLISGTWSKGDVQRALGDNFGVAVLPKFNVDGQKYDLVPYGGSKLLGVLPQKVTDRAKGLHELAMYLTNEQSQLDRFQGNGWGPSNKAAQNNQAVKDDILLKAVYAQMESAIPQGQYPGGWWDHAGLIGTEAVKATYNPANILKSYSDGLDAFIQA